MEQLKEYPGILRGQMNLGVVHFELGDCAKAKEIQTAALSLARTYGNPSDIGWILNQLSMNEMELSSFTEISALMPIRLKELRELGDLPSLCSGLTVFGSYLVENDQLEEGEKLLQESLGLTQTSAYYAAPPLGSLARLAYKRGDFSRSETLAREAFEIAVKHGLVFMKAGILALWGRVKLAQSHLSEAEQLMVESLKVGWVANFPLAVSYSLVFLAELSIAQGHVEHGVSLLSFLSRYPVIEKLDRDEALKLLEKAKSQLSPRAFSQAQKASKSLTLEGIVTGILEQGLG